MVLYSQKNDTIYLNNGDRITCEFKGLSLGKVRASTSDMKTVYIEWDRINRVVSSKFYEFETSTGEIIYGFFGAFSNDSLLITRYKKILKYHKDDVYYVNQLKDVFWKKFSGSVTIGFNATKSTNVTQYNFGSQVTFTDKKNKIFFSSNSIQSFQSDTSNQTNQSFALGYEYDITGRFATSTNVSIQKNTELGLALRYSGNLGLSYFFIKNKKGYLQFSSGGNYNNERSIEGDSVQYSLEGVFSLDFKFYKFHNPEIDLSASISYFPSFTIQGRNRLGAQLDLKWEIVSDLKIGGTLYYNFDSKPIQENSSTFDYNVVSSLTYSFN